MLITVKEVKVSLRFIQTHLEGMLVHNLIKRRVFFLFHDSVLFCPLLCHWLASPSQGLPTPLRYPFIHQDSYRQSECIAQEHNKMTTGRAGTHNAKSRVQCTRHQGTSLHLDVVVRLAWLSLSDLQSYAGWDLVPWQVQPCPIGKGR